MNEQNPTTAEPCAHDGCITCSDVAVPVRVVAVRGDDALCEDDQGNRTVVATELVAPTCKGETILVHGGVAIAKVGQNELKAESWQRNDRRERPSDTSASSGTVRSPGRSPRR